MEIYNSTSKLGIRPQNANAKPKQNALGKKCPTIYNPYYSVTKRIGIAKGMYSRVLSGYTIVQGPFSKGCRQLENQLQAMQAVSAASKAGQDE
jgi:hypothetical protein